MGEGRDEKTVCICVKITEILYIYVRNYQTYILKIVSWLYIIILLKINYIFLIIKLYIIYIHIYMYW